MFRLIDTLTTDKSKVFTHQECKRKYILYCVCASACVSALMSLSVSVSVCMCVRVRVHA